LRFFERYAPVLRLPLLSFAPIGILGLAGFVDLARRRALPFEIGVFVIAYTISVALFFVFARYRLPLVAPLAVLAAAQWINLARALHARRARALAFPAIVLCAASLLVLRPIAQGMTVANSHLSIGIALEIKGRKEEAFAEYESGLQLEPQHPKLLRHAAHLSAERDPASPETLDLLRRAHAADSASVETAFRLATALALRGERNEAAGIFESILRRGEEPPGIHTNLALLYSQLGREGDALAAAERALLQDPNDSAALGILNRDQ
jgi:tetratricopeptide (TPR) repeat protein